MGDWFDSLVAHPDIVPFLCESLLFHQYPEPKIRHGFPPSRNAPHLVVAIACTDQVLLPRTLGTFCIKKNLMRVFTATVFVPCRHDFSRHHKAVALEGKRTGHKP